VKTTKKKTSISIIIRDCKHEVLATLSEPNDHIIAPEIVETIPSLRAVNFSRKLGFYKVILEGDALQIVHALKKEGSNWCINDHLIEESIGYCTVSRVGRSIMLGII
jgi:hypothetical protein